MNRTHPDALTQMKIYKLLQMRNLKEEREMRIAIEKDLFGWIRDPRGLTSLLLESKNLRGIVMVASKGTEEEYKAIVQQLRWLKAIENHYPIEVFTMGDVSERSLSLFKQHPEADLIDLGSIVDPNIMRPDNLFNLAALVSTFQEALLILDPRIVLLQNPKKVWNLEMNVQKGAMMFADGEKQIKIISMDKMRHLYALLASCIVPHLGLVEAFEELKEPFALSSPDRAVIGALSKGHQEGQKVKICGPVAYVDEHMNLLWSLGEELRGILTHYAILGIYEKHIGCMETKLTRPIPPRILENIKQIKDVK